MAVRRFFVASSVARLIQHALGSEWRVEGYLNGGDQRRTHVVLEGDDGHLILEEQVQGNLVVEDTLVPRRQAEALLDACLGRVDIDRITLSINRRSAVLDRVSAKDKKIDLLTVDLGDGAPSTFYPPAWVGREDTGGHYDLRALATAEIPALPDSSVNNAGLEALLDLLERGALHRVPDMSLRHDTGPSRPAPVQDNPQAPPPPEPESRHQPGPDGEDRALNSPQTQPLIQLLSGVLKNAEDALPPEQATVVDPDSWGQRRKR